MEYRRQRGDMIQVYKIINQIDRINFADFFQNTTSNTRGHSKKLFKKLVNKDVRKIVLVKEL